VVQIRRGYEEKMKRLESKRVEGLKKKEGGEKNEARFEEEIRKV
jgi:hypothetical protein